MLQMYMIYFWTSNACWVLDTRDKCNLINQTTPLGNHASHSAFFHSRINCLYWLWWWWGKLLCGLGAPMHIRYWCYSAFPGMSSIMLAALLVSSLLYHIVDCAPIKYSIPDWGSTSPKNLHTNNLYLSRSLSKPQQYHQTLEFGNLAVAA